MQIDIDNIVYKMVESLTFEELLFMADELGVEHDEYSWLKDEWISKEILLKEDIEGALRSVIEKAGKIIR